MFKKEINFTSIIRSSSSNERVIKPVNGLLDLHIDDIVKLSIRTPQLDTDCCKNVYTDIYGKVINVYNDIYEDVDGRTTQCREILVELFEESNSRIKAIRNKASEPTDISFE